MTISTLATIVAVALAGLTPAGCNSAKTTAAKKSAVKPALATAAPTGPAQAAEAAVAKEDAAPPLISNGTNCFLGDLNLTNHAETWVKINPSTQCMFMTRMVDSKNAQITLSLETKNPKNRVPDLAVTQVTTRADKPLEVAFGGCSLAFTPHISD